MSSPWIDSSESGRHSISASPKASLVPGAALGGERDHLGGGEVALGEDLEDRRADGAGRADDADPVAAGHQAASSRGRTRGRCSPEGSSSRTASAPRPNASWTAFTVSGTRLGVDHAGDLDRRRRDHLDVDPALADRREDLRRDAGVAAHPGADDRDLADVRVRLDPLADVERLEHLGRRPQVVGRDREREVGLLVVGDRLVLDDHVDVDVRVGQGGEHAPGDARLVAEAGEGYARLVGVRDGCDHRLFQSLVLAEHEGTRAALDRAAAVDADAVVARVLDRAQLEDAGARRRHLEHLVERDRRRACARRGRSAGRR